VPGPLLEEHGRLFFKTPLGCPYMLVAVAAPLTPNQCLNQTMKQSEVSGG
jgi:hypothetical protein